MAYNGSGDFNRLYSWQTDRDNGVKIRADRMDAEMDGMATGLSTAICKDGQTTITANLPMSGFKHTGVAAASARNHYADVGSVQDSSFIWCGTAGGTKNALALTCTPAITAYATGQRFRFIAGGTSSDDVVTIAVSGLATKAGQIDGAALSATVFIEAGKIYDADYDGTQFQLTRLSADLQTATGGVAKLASANTFTADQTIQSADAGASAGPNLTLDRNSASPAASDVIGAIPFTGRNSTPATKTYAQVQAEIVDPTAASEDGKLSFQTQNAGTLATRGYVGQGLVIGSPTGADPGAGGVNATALQVNGTNVVTRGWGHSDSIATTSGTTAAFTSIPAGIRKIFVTLDGVSTNATSQFICQIGDSGGLEATGYTGTSWITAASGAALSTSIILTTSSVSSGQGCTGTLTLINVTGNTWAFFATMTNPTGVSKYDVVGIKTLSGTLDRLTVTTAAADTLDAGAVYLNCEY